MSPEAACNFYKTLITTCFENTSTLSNTDIVIYTTPDLQNPFIKHINQKYNHDIYLQQGNNLGDRMLNALRHSLKTHTKSVLIGSDCPFINQDYLDQAFNKLTNNNIVFGPAEDGGYVLIGARQICDGVFHRIHWGHDKVLQQSLQNINAIGYNAHLLKTLWDIDTPDDYIKYRSIHNQNTNLKTGDNCG